MSQENVEELAERYVAAVNAREVPEDLLAPEFSVENVTTAVTDKVYYGAKGLVEWASDFFEVMGPGARFEARVIELGDDYAVGELTIVGRGSTSGLPMDMRHYGVMWVRDGKVARAVGYATRREALEAVGLRE